MPAVLYQIWMKPLGSEPDMHHPMGRLGTIKSRKDIVPSSKPPADASPIFMHLCQSLTKPTFSPSQTLRLAPYVQEPIAWACLWQAGHGPQILHAIATRETTTCRRPRRAIVLGPSIPQCNPADVPPMNISWLQNPPQ